MVTSTDGAQRMHVHPVDDEQRKEEGTLNEIPR